jgi:hypothetical protein
MGCTELAPDAASTSDVPTVTQGYLNTENGLSAINGLNAINGLSSLNGLSSMNGLSSINGLNSINGYVGTNGFSAINGLSSINGLNSFNGLSSINGLSSQNGLMTTDPGRQTVSYLVKCALAAGDTLVKQDQAGVNYTYKGSLGLAPEYKNGGCGRACAEALSSCLMAHVNTTGVHIPLWMTSPLSKIGWGQSPNFPTQEGTFFGQLMVVNGSNKLDAYYCDGPNVAENTVPGRLGRQSGAPYENAFPGNGGKCNSGSNCTMTADGATSCTANGYKWNSPITVWRGQTFQAEDTSLIAPVNWQYCNNQSKCGNGKRVSWIRKGTGLTLNGVRAAVAGTNNIVVYYTNGDPIGSPTRTLLVSVNGGPEQSRDFAPTGKAWDDVVSTTITLSGFKAGNTNTVRFSGTDTAQAPDLDWFEIINTGTTSAPQTKDCAAGTTVGIKTFNNGKFVSARSDNNNNLMGQAATISTWETFDIVDAGSGTVALRSKMNNMYVAAEVGESDVPLRARSSSIGGYEKFQFVKQADGYFGIKSMQNGKYVAAVAGATNSPLRAISGSVSTATTSWEKFSCE